VNERGIPRLNPRVRAYCRGNSSSGSSVDIRIERINASPSQVEREEA